MRGIAVAAAASVILSVSAAAADSEPLFSIPVQQAAEKLDDRRPLRVALDTSDPAALSRALGERAGSTITQGRVEMVLDGYEPAHFTGDRDWLAASFFVDYLDAPVPELVARLRAASPHPRRSEVVAFVAGNVQGSSDRGMDVASQVARNRNGDCTEYAVLTAALARAVGLPARVVVGLAIVVRDDGVRAYGHAWAEVLDDGAWRVGDAALLSAAGDVRYLALGVIDDEGPGYAMNVARTMPLWVRQVTVLGSAPATR